MPAGYWMANFGRLLIKKTLTKNLAKLIKIILCYSYKSENGSRITYHSLENPWRSEGAFFST